MNQRGAKRRSADCPAQPVMQGGGFYNSHSQMQQEAAGFGVPLLERAIREVPLPDQGGVFLVADYGSSEGKNSLEIMRRVVELVRCRASDRSGALPIAVVHVDQPANDFRSLFTLVDASERSYLRASSDVFCFATGRSFFERVFPTEQVSLGWSSIAAHWISRVPVPIPDHFWNTRATGDAARALAEQARTDWQRFLDHRAHELKPGGRLVVVCGAADEQGGSGGEGLADAANGVLQTMVADRTLRRQEYERMAIPTYNRRKEEFTAPFAARHIGDRLVLEDYRQAVTPDPPWQQYERDGDAEAFGVAQAAWFRAWSETSLFRALDADRPPEDRSRLADAFFAALQEKIAADPLAARCQWQVAAMLIAKQVGR